MSYAFSGHCVPFTVSVNGGDEMSFTSANFRFGADSGLVTLAENTDWTTGVTLPAATVFSPGTIIDLNGHTLATGGLAVDGVGVVVVTNTAGLTGTWSAPVAYDAGTGSALLDGTYDFTPATPSDGRIVTMTVTAILRGTDSDHPDPDGTTQAAIRLSEDRCLQVWTTPSGGGAPEWLDVAAEACVPEAGSKYTFRFTVDYAKRCYAVELLEGGVSTRLSAVGDQSKTDFPLAVRATRLSFVRFDGETGFSSLTGDFKGARPGDPKYATMMILH